MPNIAQRLRGFGRRKPGPAYKLDTTFPPLRLPTGFWPCNEGGGGNLFDQGGQGYAGTLAGVTTWAPGNFGGPCLKFPGGAADHVNVPSTMLGSLSGKVVSAACWFNPTDSVTIYRSLFDGIGGGNRILSAFLGGAANHIFVAVAVTAGTEITLTDSWVLNTWQHFCMTSDGTTITIYRNGRNVGSAAAGIGTGFVAGQWQIGGNPSGGGAPMTGLMDLILVVPRVLSAAEVWWLYAEPCAMFKQAPPARAPHAGTGVVVARQQQLTLIGAGA